MRRGKSFRGLSPARRPDAQVRGATDARREVEQLSGQKVVPVLLADDGEAIVESKAIVAWAEAHPRSGPSCPRRTRTLDSHASRLRRKLDPGHSRYVSNCWGIGYRLIDG